MSGPVRPGVRELAWRWGPVVAWAAVIFALSAQPGLKVSSDASVDGPVRHLAHVGVFAVLAVLLVYALDGPGRPLTLRTALLAGALTIAYGITDELHQAFVPDRTANPVDVGYDTIGALLGLAVTSGFGRFGTGRRRRP